MKFRFFIYAVLLLLFQQRGLAQSPMHRHYDISSLSENASLNCAVVDQYGMMWVGTSRGLYNFDGSYFHTQSLRDSSSAAITALATVGDTLWVGFSDGKLLHRSIRIWKKETTSDTAFRAGITNIVVSNEGDLFVSTYGDGLYLRHEGTWIHYAAPQQLPANEIYCMKRSDDGVIWIGTDEGLSECRFDKSQLRTVTYSTKDGLKDQIVKSIYIDRKQQVWAGTYSGGISLFDRAAHRFITFPISNNWIYGPVTAIAVQSDRRVFVGTQNNGVISFSIDNMQHPTVFNESGGYENSKVTSILIDEEGNFWVTTKNNSLDMFPGLFQWEPALGQEVLCMNYNTADRGVWYATLEGLQYLTFDSSGASPRSISLMSGGRIPVITTICLDAEKNLWVGTLDEGVFLLPRGKEPAIQFRETNGLANNNVLSISAGDEFIWFATLGGASRCTFRHIDFRKSKPVFENFTEEKGLNSSYVYQILDDSKGRTWFATDGEGLKCFVNGKFTTIEKIDSLKVKTVYSLTEDRLGNIWFSTPSSGIFRFDGKNYDHFGEKEGVTDLAITAIVADKNNDILLIEKDGLEVYEHESGQIRRYLDRSFFEDIEPNINGYFRDASENIWIPSAKGVLKYFPPDSTFSDQARLELTRVQLFLQPFDFLSKSKFSHSNNHLTFEFQGFWNYNPSQIRYRYKLEGYDLDWIRTRDERVIYPNLPAGHYTFMVQATIHHNFNDVITRSYAFTINPPFWKTWWFITISAMMATAIIYFLVKWREQQIEREAAMRRQAIEFQLENLKTQINPHFLFNSFNTLSTLIEEDQRLAVTYVENLSDFYRHSLKFKDTDLIALNEEKELTDNYVFLLKQRHGDSLRINFHLRPEDLNYLIPPLTLQLLIENSVKHNIVSREKPLTVIIESHGQELTVKNNLQPRTSPITSTGMGMKNINARFELLGGKPISVAKTNSHFIVTVHLIKNQPS
ncbi:MAG: histidine kinase [Chitinophagales bacterium]|nr:histidine kinase [Chitinophagales bacterium]